MRNDAHNNEFSSFQSIGLTAERLASNLVKFRKFTEMLDGSVVVSNRSFQSRLECSEIDMSPPHDEAGVVGISTIPVDALEAACGKEAPLVRIVLLATCLSQIGESIVIAAPVNVVDEVGRPFASDIKPREPRGAVEMTVDPNNCVTLHPTHTAGALTVSARLERLLPSKDPGHGFVSKNLAQSFQGQAAVEQVRQNNLPILLRHPRLAGRKVLERTNQKHEESYRDAARDRAEKENAERHREYVDQRLRELTAFERKVSGKKI